MKYLKKFENKEPVKKVEYYDNGNIKSRRQHREDGPAVEEWYEDGQKEEEKYFLNNKIHREDGPAYQKWDYYGQKTEEWYCINGEYHREDGPSIIHWYANGNNYIEKYYINDKKHRDDGPAEIWFYYNEIYYQQIYYINDKKHREDGPAVQEWYESGNEKIVKYYLKEVEYDREDWLEKLKEMKSSHYKEQQMLYNMEKNIKKYNL